MLVNLIDKEIPLTIAGSSICFIEYVAFQAHALERPIVVYTIMITPNSIRTLVYIAADLATISKLKAISAGAHEATHKVSTAMVTASVRIGTFIYVCKWYVIIYKVALMGE